MDLSKDIYDLIDLYVSELHALGARYGALAYLLGFSDCIEMFRNTLQVPKREENSSAAK